MLHLVGILFPHIHRSKFFCQTSVCTHTQLSNFTSLHEVLSRMKCGINTTFLLPFILCTSCTECVKIKILWIKVSLLKLYRNNEFSSISSAYGKTCRGNLSYSRLATAKLLEAVLTSMKLGLSLFLQLNDGSVHSCMSSLCTRWHPWCVWPVTIRRGFNISISWKSQQSWDTRTETGILCSG